MQPKKPIMSLLPFLSINIDQRPGSALLPNDQLFCTDTTNGVRACGDVCPAIHVRGTLAVKEYTEWQQLNSIYENLKAAFCEGLRGRIGGTVPS